jgi:hypothetical protein
MENKTNAMVESYLETAKWTSHDYDEDCRDATSLEQYDWSEAAVKEAEKEIEDFKYYLDEIGLDWSTVPYTMMGHNFWLSRNRHGAGFWDCGLGKLGDALHKAAITFGTKDVYLGDDNLIYFC